MFCKKWTALTVPVFLRNYVCQFLINLNPQNKVKRKINFLLSSKWHELYTLQVHFIGNAKNFKHLLKTEHNVAFLLEFGGLFLLDLVFSLWRKFISGYSMKLLRKIGEISQCNCWGTTSLAELCAFGVTCMVLSTFHFANACIGRVLFQSNDKVTNVQEGFQERAFLLCFCVTSRVVVLRLRHSFVIAHRSSIMAKRTRKIKSIWDVSSFKSSTYWFMIQIWEQAACLRFLQSNNKCWGWQLELIVYIFCFV